MQHVFIDSRTIKARRVAAMARSTRERYVSPKPAHCRTVITCDDVMPVLRYDSAKGASIHMGLRESAVASSIRTGRGAGGRRWRYLDEAEAGHA